MKFLLCLVMFFLLLNGLATAQTLIQDSCKKAAATDPQFKYDFCVTSLEQDPASKTATSLKGLLVASMKNAASQTTSVKGIAEKLLNDKKYGKDIAASLSLCVELYGDAQDAFTEALDSVKSRDYVSVNTHLSAALDAPDTCEDGFKEGKQLKSPIENENYVLYQKILIPLAFSTMLR